MSIDLNNIPIADSEYDPYTNASNTAMPQSDLLTMHDAFQPRQPIQYVVDNFLAEAGLSLFFGEPGGMKTYSLLDMALCVSIQKDWIGRKTTQGAVLVVDEDNGRDRMLNRMEEIARGHNADHQIPFYCLSFHGFDFGQDKYLTELQAFINVMSARLVIIDTLRNVSPGRDENSAKDMTPILLGLRRVAQKTRAAIAVIHHPNKSGNYSGTTSLKGSVDVMVKVEYKAATGEVIFRPEKYRDGGLLNFSAKAEFGFDISNARPTFQLVPSQKAVKPTPNTYNKAETFVLLYLFNHGESKSSELTGSIDPLAGDPAPKSVSNAISKLRTDQLIRRTDNGTMGTTGTYELTTLGNQEAENL